MCVINKESHYVPASCMRCAKNGLTCCYYQNDVATDMLLPISHTECKIITSFLRLPSTTACFDEETVTIRFQNNMKGMFPGEEEKVEALFPLDSKRFRFALRGEIKHCVFLTSNGCLLPRNVRPILCNVFPFWIHTNGSISLFGNCELAPRDSVISSCITDAKTSIPELYALYNLLRMFWGFS